MQESCTVKTTEEVGEMVQQDAFEVGVFLMSADDVWCGSERIVV